MASSVMWVWLSGMLFAVSHSLLATQRCKSWLYQHQLCEQYYRLLYSVVAIVALAVWLLYLHQLPDMPLYQTDGVLWWLLKGVQSLGLFVVLAGFHAIDGLLFLGLRRVDQEQEPFIEYGIYRYIRHPMYAGAMLLLFAAPTQTWNGLNFALLTALYFIIGSRFEEARMLALHPDYRSYQGRIPAFIPRFQR